MKNKGFTLIELLAVIVILAIIALIATPIVMNIIADSKKGAAERSADNYIDAVDTAVTNSLLDPANKMNDGLYYIDKNGNLCNDTLNVDGECVGDDRKAFSIDTSGTKPTSGTVVIANGIVVPSSTIDGTSYATNLTTSGYTVSYNSETKKYVATAKVCTKISGEELAIGSQYECKVGEEIIQTFYVLEVTEDNVSLIMDSNINSDGVAVKSDAITNKGFIVWSSVDDYLAARGTKEDYGNYGNNSKGPITALNYLNTATSAWTNVTVSLPTYNQIYNVNKSPDLKETLWLYGYLTGIEGYWTSTPNSSYSYNAWYVTNEGRLNYRYVNYDKGYGVRPVITVSKSNL